MYHVVNIVPGTWCMRVGWMESAATTGCLHICCCQCRVQDMYMLNQCMVANVELKTSVCLISSWLLMWSSRQVFAKQLDIVAYLVTYLTAASECHHDTPSVEQFEKISISKPNAFELSDIVSCRSSLPCIARLAHTRRIRVREFA